MSDSPAINMRNIPKDNEYFALLIEFDYQDFSGLSKSASRKKEFVIGQTTETLKRCLQQFVEISPDIPKELWSTRKREIISLLCHLGYRDVLSLLANPQIKDQLHQMFVEKHFLELPIHEICQHLAISESTLRRKLKQEGTSVQEVKDQARMGTALNLLQTTRDSISLIAEKCGYQSQSRFTSRFKQRFGLTPSELRKTQMAD